MHIRQTFITDRQATEAIDPGKGPPSRQGESHPLPLTEPCIHLSAYTARDVPTAVPGCGQAYRLLPHMVVGPPDCPGRPAPFARPALPGVVARTGRSAPVPCIGTLPLAVRQLEDLPSTMMRVAARNRSSRMAGRVPRGQPSSSERQVPKVHTRAQATLAPPVCRTPPGQ